MRVARCNEGIFFLVLLLSGKNCLAQPSVEWTSSLDYAGLLDAGYDLVVDDDLNSYVAGSAGNVVNAVVGSDFCTAKLNPLGDTLWVRYWGDAIGYSDAATSVALDESGNVIVCGWSQSSLWNTNLVIIKYDPDGNQLWTAATSIGSGTEVEVKNLVVKGNSIYACATQGWGSYSMLLVKYEASGTLGWSRIFEGPFLTARAAAVGVDELENIYLAGTSLFDLPAGSEMMVVKFNAAGDLVWLAHDAGPLNAAEETKTMLLSGPGETILAGKSDSSATGSFCLIKFNASGAFQWFKSFAPPGDLYAVPTDVAGDAAGDFFVTGYSSGSSLPNFLTAKFDTNGNLLWAKEFNNPLVNREAFAQSCVTDQQGAVYVTGYVNDSIGIAGYQWDIYTVKYDASGNEEWSLKYQGAGNQADQANTLVIDADLAVLVAGYSNHDLFLIKYSQPTGWHPEAGKDRAGIFPNPISTISTLSFYSETAGLFHFELLNRAGKICLKSSVYMQTGNNQIPLDFTFMPAGMYLLRILRNDMELIQKVTIE